MPPRITSTPRQKKLAQIWVENELNNTGLSFKEMALRAGYPLGTAAISGKRTLMKEGTQRAIRELEINMKDALMAAGVGPDYLAQKIQQMLEGRFEKDVNFRAINYGLEHALKIGMGGGYKPEEKRTVNVNISPEDLKKYAPLRDEYEEKLRQEELGGE